MVEDVSLNKPFTHGADESRLAALLRLYLFPINSSRSALPSEPLDALTKGFIQ